MSAYWCVIQIQVQLYRLYLTPFGDVVELVPWAKELRVESRYILDLQANLNHASQHVQRDCTKIFGLDHAACSYISAAIQVLLSQARLTAIF